MVRSRIHVVLALALTLPLSACFGPASLADRIQEQHVAPDALVRLSEAQAVAAKRDGSRVVVLNFASTPDGWEAEEIAGSSVGTEASSLHVFSLGGTTLDEWNTFVYGTAPDRVSRVRLSGFDYEGGQVANGAWVIVLRTKDVEPQDLQWEFVDASGGIVESGEGIFPPEA